MNTSLSWIEWLERLDRILTSARKDVAAMAKSGGGNSLAAIERSKRQLSALTRELRLLDRRVLVREADGSGADRASDLQRALDTALLQLGSFVNQPYLDQQLAARSLNAIDSALRDSRYEAEILIGARRRRA
jgi:hypothetical protein